MATKKKEKKTQPTGAKITASSRTSTPTRNWRPCSPAAGRSMHGVAQTPRVIAALVALLGVDTLALEWPTPLTATVDANRRSGELPDDELLWLGDGR